MEINFTKPPNIKETLISKLRLAEGEGTGFIKLLQKKSSYGYNLTNDYINL